jgi:hypothetical protein
MFVVYALAGLSFILALIAVYYFQKASDNNKKNH